jgi:two-component system, LuxR family, response regulator FixJ
MTDSLVYIVEQNPEVPSKITPLLDTIQYKYKVFKSGNEFLKHYKKSIPACAIIDVDIPFEIEDERVKKLTYLLPKKSGLSLHSTMKDHDIKIPVIFTTITPDVDIISSGFRAGALDFLEIPIKVEIMVSRISEALKIDR